MTKKSTRAKDKRSLPRPRDPDGRLLPIPAERRAAILTDARERIMGGETLQQIADAHAISRSTLKLWLHDLGDEYTDLRRRWLDKMLADAREAIEHAADTLDVARARELWKSATWYAERRDPGRYGQRVQTTGTPAQVVLVTSLALNRRNDAYTIQGVDASEDPALE